MAVQTLGEQLGGRFQGLPGLGVNGSAGSDGPKGRSVYVGYIRSFFDYQSAEDYQRNMLYYRGRTSTSGLVHKERKDFYYRYDENFYREIEGKDKPEILAFSLRNVRGVYFDKPGWTTSKNITYRTVVRSDDFYKRRVDPTKPDGEDWIPLKGYTYFGAPEGDDVAISNWEKRHTTVDKINFNLFLDDEYIRMRDENDSQTIFSQNPGIFVPTNLKRMIQEGDILYVLDDITSEIISYIIVTADIVGCSFEHFLNQYFIPCESLLSTFKRAGDRAVLNRSLILPVVPDGKGGHLPMRFAENFVRRVGTESLLSILCNSITDGQPLLELVSGDNRLKLGYSSVLYPQSEERVSDNIVISAKEIRLRNFFMKDIMSNINVKEYFDANVRSVSKYKHVEALGTSNVTVSEEQDNVKLRVPSNLFLVTGASGRRYGVEIWVMNHGGTFSLLRRIVGAAGGIDFTLTYDNGMLGVGERTLGFTCFVEGEGTATCYSGLSTLEYKSEIGDGGFRITEHTFRKAEVANTEISDSIFDDESCSFVADELTCEKQQGKKMTVTSEVENAVIRNVWVNDKPIVTDYQTVAPPSGLWFSFSGIELSADGKELIINSLDVDENIPDIEFYDEDGNLTEVLEPKCIGEALAAFSHKGYEIGQRIQETKDRSMVFVVETFDRNTGKTSTCGYTLTQPGFRNPLHDITVAFGSNFRNDTLEKQNSPEIGVMCNQLQFFTALKVDGFADSTWGMYLDNPRLRVAVGLDTETTTNLGDLEYCSDTNYNNVHVYSVKDKNRYSNNAFKVDFGWVDGNRGYKSDSSLGSYGVNAMSAQPYTGVRKSLPCDVDDGWVSLNDVMSDRQGSDTQIPYDFVYVIENTDASGENVFGSCVGGEAGLGTGSWSNNDDPVRIRTMMEVANPIPMEFNFRWRVERIDVVGKLRAEFRETWGSLDAEAKVGEELTFSKTINDRSMMSENAKFIINPVTTVLCPEEFESQQMVRGAVKKVGSAEPFLISHGIMDIDVSARAEFERNGYSDPYKRYMMSKFGGEGSIDGVDIADIAYYLPKNKYLQDNIKNLSVTPRSLSEVYSEGRVALSKDYAEVNALLNENRELANGKLDLYPIAFGEEEIVENGYNDCMVRVSYDSRYMNPTLREGVSTFYYNDELLEAEPYQQHTKVSPLWARHSLLTEISDDGLNAAKKVWNFEYESSSEYKDADVFGGVLSKSGNGYSRITDASIDYGQYEGDGTLSLAETRSRSEEYILAEPLVSSLEPPVGFRTQPDEDKFFRSFALDVDWCYPHFITVNSVTKVSPYQIVNPYEMLIDREVLGDLSGMNPDNLMGFFDGKAADEHLFFEGRDASAYLSRKFSDGALAMREGELVRVDEEKVVRMFIPYNLVWDLQPRTMHNTDMDGDVMNILMLQQPSVIRDGNFSFDKRFFEVSEDDTMPVVSPWEFNK